MIRMCPFKNGVKAHQQSQQLHMAEKPTASLLAIVNFAPHRSKSASAFTAANVIALASEKTVKAS